MKVLRLLLACLVCCASVAAQTDIKLEIGAKLPRKYVPAEITGQVLTSPSQTRSFIKSKIHDVVYLIAFDEKTRRIKYIYTNDDNFRTVNGLAVDSELTFTLEQLTIFSGWEIRAPATPDGWFPVIATDADMLGGDFIAKLKKGEQTTMTINGFSKGDN